MSALCTGETTSDDVYNRYVEKARAWFMTFGCVTVTDQNITPEASDERQVHIKAKDLAEFEHIFDIQLLRKSFTIKPKPNSKV